MKNLDVTPLLQSIAWPKSSRALLVAAVISFLIPCAGRTAEIKKTDDTNALNVGTSWVGGNVPGGNDVALFDSTVTGTISPSLGGGVFWKGIKVTNPGGLTVISNATAVMLTNGPGGIDLSGAAQDLIISNSVTVLPEGDQTWNVGSGRLLQLTVAVPMTAAGGLFPRGVVNFTGGGTKKIANNNNGSTGVVRGWAIVNGIDWATKDGSGNIVAYAGYSSLNGGGVIAAGSTVNYSIDTAGTFTWSGNTSFNTMRVTGNGATAINCTSSGNSRFDIFDGFMMTPGAGPVTLNLGNTTNPISGTCRFRPRTGNNLPFYFIQNSTNDLILNIPIHATADPANNTNTIVKSGSGRLILNHPWSTIIGSMDAGGWDINQGTLSIGYPDGTLVNTSLGNGGNVLGSYPPVVMPRNLTLNGGTFQARTNSTIEVNRGWMLGVNGGGIDVEGNTTNGAATSLIINGVITSQVAGVGDLTISQSGSFGGSVTLNASNTYSGNTIISSGTLRLGASGSVDSPKITLNANSTFDASALGGYTVASGKSLGGGSVAGIATNNSSLIVASGAGLHVTGAGGSVGKLAIAGDLALNGNPVTVNVTGSPLLAGTYRLVDCSGTLTGVANATPIISGLGLESGAAGTISTTAGSVGHVDLVVTGGVPVLRVTSTSLSGNQLTLSGSGGTASGNFTVLTSPSASAPVNTWTTWATGTFNGSGGFSITGTIPGGTQAYFRVREP